MMKYMVNRFGLKCVVMLSMGLCVWTLGSSQVLYRIGTSWCESGQVEGYQYGRCLWISVSDVSDDGMVVGQIDNQVWVDEFDYRYVSLFYWTADAGIQQFYIGSPDIYATALTAGGRIIVGSAEAAFLWTEASGLQNLNDVYRHLITDGSYLESATDITPNGSHIVGIGYNAAQQRLEPYLLETGLGGGQPRLTWLGTLGIIGHFSSLSVSADGRTVVGTVEQWQHSRLLAIAFRWTAETGIHPLVTLGGTSSHAAGVSADGSVVVGWAESTNGERRAARWIAGVGVQDMGIGAGSGAVSVSGDGRIVVGYYVPTPGRSSTFRWTAEGGLQDLNVLYSYLLGSWRSVRIATISPSGRYILGSGYDTSMQRWGVFLLDTECTPRREDVNDDGYVDDADLLSVLNAFGQVGSEIAEDVNRDGAVDDADLLAVLFMFGWQRCP